MILGVNGRFLGARTTGVQRFATEIVSRLWDRIGEGVLLLPADVAVPVGLPEHVIVARGRHRGQAWERLELNRLARRSGCSVVLNPANTVPFGGGPHVVVVHDVEPLVRPEAFSPAFRTWYRYAVAPAVRRAARVVTVSHAAAREIERVLGVPADRLHVADQGAAPLDRASSEAEVGAVRRRFALTLPYLLAIGGSDPRKNVAFLRRVLALWTERRRGETGIAPVPSLVVVSGGLDRVFARIRDERAPGELRVGRVDDETLRALYTAASALVFPSVAEGFGRPPLEALACGTPVITGPYAAAREVVGSAAEVLPLDPARWVSALISLLGEAPAAAAARCRRGKEEASQHSWDAGVGAVLDACRQAASARTSSRARVTAGSPESVVPGSSAPVPPEVGVAAGASASARAWSADRRVALVHDWFTSMRGGEKVVEALLELFPNADLFTLLHVPGAVSEAIEARHIRTSFIQRLPEAARRYRSYLPLFPRAIESFDLRGYDLVVSSSHCVAKGVIPAAGASHLCFCHTPMRYIWDQADAYLAPGRAHPLIRAAAPPIVARLRRWDIASADRVHRFVANSEHVKNRIRRYWGREAGVVFPPVDVDRFVPDVEREEFYLVVSALVPYKRVDLAVDVLGRRMGRRLVVVGSGPEMQRLRAAAGGNVRFTGWIDDAEIADLMARCRALVMPGVEDFGIAPVEAQAAGAPVIALGEGGVLETVIAGTGPDATGVFFGQPTPESMIEAVRRFEAQTFSSAAARASALRFTRTRFLEGIAREIDLLLGRS